MVFSYARVSTTVSLKTEDYNQDGMRWWFRFREKGGKQHHVPRHAWTLTFLLPGSETTRTLGFYSPSHATDLSPTGK